MWTPHALASASDLEGTPPAVSPAEAQGACNFIIWVPVDLPAGSEIASPSLRREAPPGPSPSIARTPWSENNPSAYRFEVSGPGRRLRIKEFHYDWAFPALDHPCLWESETRAVPLRGPYVLWFGVDYMGKQAASARIGRTMIEASVLEGEFSDDELLALYRSLRPALRQAAEEIYRTPFSQLCYPARYPQATMVNVPIGMWKFGRPDKRYEGEWLVDDADVLAAKLGLPLTLAGFQIDSAARFADGEGRSEIEAVYTAGSDRGQELRVIVQRTGEGRIEFLPSPRPTRAGGRPRLSAVVKSTSRGSTNVTGRGTRSAAILRPDTTSNCSAPPESRWEGRGS
jgi:hypothetical protein